MDTIYALATAQGKSGVAIVRVSGPLAWDACRALAGGVPEPRRASVRRLVTGDGGFLDEALVLSFEKNGSFTGEAVVEFHLHGSIAVVSAVLKTLGGQPGLRMAEPGEFTRRALENGRLELTQVEGLADLIDAETESQRVQALRVLSGELGERVAGWRRDLIRAASLLEAVMDFVDEDVPVDVSSEVLELLDRVHRSVLLELAGFSGAERVRSGFEVAIVGAPNVGKSTLLNALVGREAAITSEVAGTTRDVIEVRMDLGGLAVTLLDTAGLRETDDVIESMGVALARRRADSADLRVFLVGGEEITDLDLKGDDLVVFAKADLRPDGLGISGATGHGVDKLVRDICDRLSVRAGKAGLATRERHRVALEQGASALLTAESVVSKGTESYDIAAEEIRIAIRKLGSMVGAVDVEDFLDEIFSSFCIGK